MTTAHRSARTPSTRASEPRRTLRHRTGLAAVSLAGLGLLLAGCGSGGPGGIYGSESASPTTSAAPTSSAPSAEPSPTATATTGAGCAPTETVAPAGVTAVQVIDVDGDGRPDTAWISGGANRSFGITTASGATFSSPINTASPIPAQGVVNVVGADSTPIALVDVGREALLYSLADCAVTQTKDSAGAPYTFDRGFGDQGTGVGCTESGGALQLAGLLATEQGAGWTVTRTFVDLSQKGAVATNGEKTVVATDAAASDPVVVTAQEVSCGDLVAGQDGLVEASA